MRIRYKSASVPVFILAIILLIVGFVRSELNAQFLDSEIKKQNTKIGELSDRVSKYTYNPSSLTECLDNATKEYEVFIKSNGDVVASPDEVPTYNMPEAKWKEADTKLKADQANCEAMFGRQ